MRLPSVKTLSTVFDDPKQARAILEMSRAQLLALPAGEARARECYHPPKTWDVRMHCLNAIDPGLHGLESMESTGGEYAEYLNTGDTYAPTLIYWCGAYRVQSVGNFVETMGRAGVRFA
jgi:hypothetical protein